MKILLKSIDSSELNIDLKDVSSIEMYGSRESKSGWVMVAILMRSGILVPQRKMLLPDYEQLVIDWNASQ